MDMQVRVLMTLTGVAGLLSHAAAETPQEQRSRCNVYAERAVAQYNLAAAHPQCRINVDLVWQPSRDFHYGTCMNVSRTISEQTAATRDTVLQTCATEPAQASTMPLPTELKQCERSLLKFCGIWTLRGAQYEASWSNGAKATVSVTSFDGHSIALHRVDPADSTTPGLTADYLGEVDGGKMKGKVTFTWPGHTPSVGYGTWDATFTPAPPQPTTSQPLLNPSSANGSTAMSQPSGSGNMAAAPASTAVVSQPRNVAGIANSECALPAAPPSWFDPANKVFVGQMWKIENGVLSYTEFNEKREPRSASYRVTRPKFWQRWAACAPKDAVTALGVGSWWIWIADDQREARLFDVIVGNQYVLPVRVVPINLVLAEEAQKL